MIIKESRFLPPVGITGVLAVAEGGEESPTNPLRECLRLHRAKYRSLTGNL